MSLNFIGPPIRWATAIIAACFVWMGLGCAMNARRCHRRHCYYASPVLLFGALLTMLVGFGVIYIGTDGLVYVTWGTYGAVLLTFLPEKIYGKYRAGGGDD